MESTTIKKTFSVIPGLNMGLFAPKDFQNILNIINKYDVPRTKITGAQRLALLDMDQDEIPKLHKELKGYIRPQVSNGVHYVQACPGSKWCKYGIADSLKLGENIEQIALNKPLQAKVKVGVAGCRMCCTEPYVRDIGVFASKSGWTLVFGGNGGGNPRLGDIVAKSLTDEEILTLITKCLTVYQEKARPTSRTARFMTRFGIDALQELVLK